jgi:hypothetical protein
VLAETENLIAGRTPLARWRAGVFDDVAVSAAMQL